MAEQLVERLVEAQVRERLRASVGEAGSAKAWAAIAGLSPQYVSDVLRGRSAPGAGVLRVLGLQREAVYVAREPEDVELVDADGEVLVRAQRVYA